MENNFTRIEQSHNMMTKASLKSEGIEVIFADGISGLIPYSVIPEIENFSVIDKIKLPNFYELHIILKDKKTIELPWDFVRHYCDQRYKPRVDIIANYGRQTLGDVIRRIREKTNITQDELARLAGISRVTEVRLENGKHSPRYRTLQLIAKALDIPVSDLLSGFSHEEKPKDEVNSTHKSQQVQENKQKEGLDVNGKNSSLFIANEKLEESLARASMNEWKAALRLIKEVEIILPEERKNDIRFEIKAIWLCIQKTSIGPLIEKAEKLISGWKYDEASIVLENITDILLMAKYPLDYENFSSRITIIACNSCKTADRWMNQYEKKIDRVVIGVGNIKSNVEELLERKVDEMVKKRGDW
jgi:transcriptional regulator with XRE-family HTH domain